MRFDVENLGELDRAMHDYKAAATAETLIVVFHTPGNLTFRFIIGQHGIERQDCDPKGDARE